MADLDLSISGRIEVGETLTAWVLGTPASLQWQALVNGSWINVGMADSPTFVIPSTAVGTAYRIAATSGGQTFTSPATGPVTLDSKKSSAPVLGGSDLAMLSPEGADAHPVFSWLTLSDADRVGYAGGSLLVQNSNSLQQGGDGHDVLSIRFASGVGAFSLDAATREVRYTGTASTFTIGTLDAGLQGNGTDLKVTFNANATVAIVDALVNNLQYHNLDDSPVTSRLLTLRITDDSGASVQRVLAANLEPQPDAPVVTGPTAFEVAENTAVAGTLAAIDPDVEAGQPQGITWSLVAGEGAADNARFQIEAGTGELRFVQAPDHEAADHAPTYSVRVRATDANGGTAEQVVGITVTDVNEAPIAADAIAAVGENAPPVHIAPAFADPEGGPVSIALDTTGTVGVVTQQGDAFVYDPAGRFESLAQGAQATDRFHYAATDATGLAVTREVQVVVTGENDAPVFTGTFTGSVTEAGAADNGIAFAGGAFAISDVDAGDTWSWSLSGAPQYGSVALTDDGHWSYGLFSTIAGPVQALAEGETLTDSFALTVTDRLGGTTTQRFDITIHGANDAPAPLPPATVLRDLVEPGWSGNTPVAGDLVDEGPLFTTDPEGDALTWGPPIVYGQYGTFYIDDVAKTYRYEADGGAVDSLRAGQSVTDTVRFVTVDSHGASTEQTMSFVIGGSNDAPVVMPGGFEAAVVVPVPDGILQLDSTVAGGVYAVAQDAAGHLLLTGRSAYGWSQTVMRFNADGTVDGDFGTKGVAELAGITVAALATDPSGRVIVAGSAYGGSNTSDFAIARLQADGSVDTTFGANGLVTLDFAGDYDQANQVLVQADGKLLLAGSAQPSPQGYAQLGIARVDANGMPDMAFGNGGSVIYQLAEGTSTADYRVALDAAGRMLIWGTAVDYANGGERVTTVSRYLADGSLDAGFGQGGTATLSLGTWYANKASAIALEDDGGFVLGWNQYENGQHTIQLTRFAADGQVHTAFGAAGTVATGLLTNYYSDFGLQIDAAGRLVLAPQLTASPGGNQDFTVARYLADGSPDLNFGLGGLVRTDLGSDDRVEHLLITGDGHLVAAGNVMAGGWGSESAALVRYTGDGTLDTAFGGLETVQAEGWAWAWDPEGGPVDWAGTADGTFGAVTVDPWGHWLYQLDPSRPATQGLPQGATALDSFTLAVTDDAGTTTTQELVITVVGSAPMA